MPHRDPLSKKLGACLVLFSFPEPLKVSHQAERARVTAIPASVRTAQLARGPCSAVTSPLIYLPGR
jgi:hypothetical protein